jgi:hypothetical protein
VPELERIARAVIDRLGFHVTSTGEVGDPRPRTGRELPRAELPHAQPRAQEEVLVAAMTNEQRTAAVAVLHLSATTERTVGSAARHLRVDDQTRRIAQSAYSAMALILRTTIGRIGAAEIERDDDFHDGVCLLASARLKAGWVPA